MADEMTPQRRRAYEAMHRENTASLLAIVYDFLGIKPEEPTMPEVPTSEEAAMPVKHPKPPGLLLGEELTEEEKEKLLPNEAKELIRELGGVRCFRVLAKKKE